MLIAQRSSSSWDWVGQGLSVLCIAHCLALPLVLSLLPAAAAELPLTARAGSGMREPGTSLP